MLATLYFVNLRNWMKKDFNLSICNKGSSSVFEFNEFKPRLKSPKNRFQFKNLIQIKVEQTKFEPRLKFKPWLKFFKFGLRFVKDKT